MRMTEEQEHVFNEFNDFVCGIRGDDDIKFSTLIYEDTMEMTWEVMGWGYVTVETYPKEGKIMHDITFCRYDSKTYTLVHDYVSKYGERGNSIIEDITDLMNGDCGAKKLINEVLMYYTKAWFRDEEDK